jgi:hypothetical protein
MSGSDDDRIGRALSEQRRLDEGLAPDFRALLARPRPRANGGAARRVLVLAAALLVAVGVALWSRSRPHVPHPSRPVSVADASLTTWRSPTDFLLETPGLRLWSSPPVFGSVETEKALSHPEGEKGKKS